jgi:RNA polymerase sigma factor (sigma-70 family)
VPGNEVEGLLRQLAPQVLGALVRRYGHFDTAEDAVQEALIAAATQWPDGGLPDNPRAWLIAVAARRLTDLLRSEQARQRREDTVARWVLPEQWLAPSADRPAAPGESDDTLILLFMCCHPALAPAGQIALTLRAVGGLTTAEVARAFLVPEATMTRRISRAKQRVKDSGVPFGLPPPAARAARLDAVLHVLYLIFNEGYASTAGPHLQRAELSGEAIRLARMVHLLLPRDAEVTGLLALMLLVHARRDARTGPDGDLVLLDDQDRGRWDRTLIEEGRELVVRALTGGPVGPYAVQAAIAALHDEAVDVATTDWPQIVALYDVLARIAPSPLVALNRAVAVAMRDGPAAGLVLLDALADEPRLRTHHLYPAARADLLLRLGRTSEAAQAYRRALELVGNDPERRFLTARLDSLRRT